MRMYVRYLVAAVIALATFATVGAGVASATTPTCASGGGLGAHINKGDVHAGERVGLTAQVYTSPGFDTFPPGCSMTDVNVVATFADGTSATIVSNGTVKADGHQRLFTKRVTVQSSYLTDDPTYGELFRVTMNLMAMSGGAAVTLSATYSVSASG